MAHKILRTSSLHEQISAKTKNALSASLAALACLAVMPSAHAEDAANLQGVWSQQGYGKILNITSTDIVSYDHTDSTCLIVSKGKIADEIKKYDRITRTGPKLSLYEAGGVTRYDYALLNGLPARCDLLGSKRVKDPVYSFAELGAAFRENYAFFKLRNLDWAKLHAAYRDKIAQSTTDAQLFDTMALLLRALDDGHVGLNGGNQSFSSGSVGELQELWMAATGQTNWKQAEPGYRAAVKKHVETGVLKDRGRTGLHGLLNWGFVSPEIGYLNVVGMEPDPDEVPLPELLAQVDATMDQILTDLQAAKVVIVDARFNDGGYDAMALQIMAHLIDGPKLAFTKRAVKGNDFTPIQRVEMRPVAKGKKYTCPLVFLQSGTTISAAEAFTIAMQARTSTIRVGRKTYGALSDQLEKTLPNGWTVTISNEQYFAANGKLYEMIGVPPDIEVPIKNSKDFDNQLKIDFEAGLEQAKKSVILETGCN